LTGDLKIDTKIQISFQAKGQKQLLNNGFRQQKKRIPMDPLFMNIISQYTDTIRNANNRSFYKSDNLPDIRAIFVRSSDKPAQRFEFHQEYIF